MKTTMLNKTQSAMAAVLGGLCVLLPISAHAKLNVVATTPDLAAIAREVGGDRIDVRSLAKPTEDSHFVQAKPSFIVVLNHADVLVEGGAELEVGWLPPLVEGSRNTKLAAGSSGRVLANQGVEMMEVPTALDRSQGDIHAAGNPHLITDPVNAKIAARNICDAFCKLDAGSADFYRANLAKFSEQLDTKMAEWQKMLAPFQGQQIVAYHNTWPYFARRFGLKVDLFLEPKPGIPPSPAHLQGAINRMKADHVHVIIVEPYQNRKTAEAVAADAGATVVDFAQYPGGVKGTEGGYIALLDYLIGSLAKALGEVK